MEQQKELEQMAMVRTHVGASAPITSQEAERDREEEIRVPQFPSRTHL
jgi:hypothetical protein